MILKWLRESSPTASEVTRAPAGQNTPVSTADLVPLAKSVAEAKDPRVEIPLEILLIIQDVLSSRQGFARWYKALARFSNDASLKKSNAKHQHFIKVLERVFEVLRVEYKNRKPNRKKAMPELWDAVGKHSNIYQILELEDIEEDFLQTEPSESAKKSKNQSQSKHEEPAPEYQLEDDEHQEKMFAIWALLHDLHEIRLVNLGAWERHASGECGFFTAVRTADRAVYICVQLSMQLTDAYRDLETYDLLMAFLHLSDRERSPSFTNCKQEDFDAMEELLCEEAYSTLFHFRDLQCFYWCKKRTPQYRLPAERTVPFPKHPFSKALLAIFRDAQDVLPKHNAKGGQDGDALENINSAVDRYTHSLLVLADTGRIGIGMVYATQMHLDIYDQLDGDMTRGLREATKVADCTHSIMNEYTTFCINAPRCIQAHLFHPTVFDRYTPLQSRLEQKGWRIQSTDKGFKSFFLPRDMMRSLPLLAGMQGHKQLRCLQNLGASMLNEGQSLLSLAHLYRAAKERGIVTKDWADVEMLMSSQREQFVRPGSSMSSMAKQYSIALGLPLNKVHFRSGCEPTLPSPDVRAEKTKKFREKADLEHGGTKSWDMNISLGYYSFSDLQTHYEGLKEYLAHGGTIKNTAIAEQFETTKRLTGGQLLSALADIMVEEEQHLHFGYIGFLMSYLALFLEIRKDYHHPSDLMCEVVHDMLWKAASAELRGVSLGKTALVKAGQSIEDFIQQSGDQFSTVNINSCNQSASPEFLQNPLGPVMGEPKHPKSTSGEEADAKAIRDVLNKAHRIHTHKCVDDVMDCSFQYRKVLAGEYAPADAAEVKRGIVDFLTMLNIDPKIVIGNKDGKLTRRQTETLNKSSYNNAEAKGGDISPEDVEKVLKDAVPILFQKDRAPEGFGDT